MTKKIKKLYKITCEFYIVAEDERQAEEVLRDDSDFIENHCMIDETTDKVKKEDIYNL